MFWKQNLDKRLADDLGKMGLNSRLDDGAVFLRWDTEFKVERVEQI